MKNEKGITLIALVVTIIVLLIIASVATYTGINSIKDSKNQSYMSEVKMLQQAVLENYTKYLMTKDDMYIRGTLVQYSEMQTLVNSINSKSSGEKISLKASNYSNDTSSKNPEGYYSLTQSDLKDMDVSISREDTYIVNYSTGEVINATLLVTGDGKPLYVYARDNT